MKSYNERTNDVLDKVEQMQKGKVSEKPPVHRTKTFKRIFAAALSAAAVLVLSLVLFVPIGPDAQNISAYKKSEYYGVIKAVNDLTAKPPKYKNNFEKLVSSVQDFFGNNGKDAQMPAVLPDGSNNGGYVENTNNQVAGVTEGDLLKRSEKYAFYLSFNPDLAELYLNIYTVNGAQSERVSKFLIATADDYVAELYYESAEIYLSADCNTVTVISNAYRYKSEERLYTRVVGIDVSDVSRVEELSRTYISGDYISSRIVDGELYVFTNMAVYNPDFKNESTYLPQTGGNLNDMTSLPAEDIVCDKNADIARFTVVSKFQSGEICDSIAFLSYSTEAYVSADNIYLTHEYKESGEDKTDIARVSYGGGKLKYENGFTVEGSVNDQFSLDEKDGALRVVTTVNSPAINASLYIIDIEKGECIASHENFAPDGERVYSVRFDGDIAYVCTARRTEYIITDPVYAIDLSDPQNITSKDTGDIAGYSSTLIKFKDGLLLGIGSSVVQTTVNGYVQPSEGLKIELYEERADGLESFAKYERAGKFSTEFKAYYIDAERGLIGIAVADGGTAENVQYCLLLFDGYNFIEVETVDLDDRYLNAPRAFYESGNIYLYHNDNNYVIELG